jgi:hypothetical protein
MSDENKHCLRCGSKRGERGGCGAWGTSYPRHLFREKPNPAMDFAPDPSAEVIRRWDAQAAELSGTREIELPQPVSAEAIVGDMKADLYPQVGGDVCEYDGNKEIDALIRKHLARYGDARYLEGKRDGLLIAIKSASEYEPTRADGWDFPDGQECAVEAIRAAAREDNVIL